ncbi:MAG: hypothetical protein ACEQSF_06100, partial [Solirubrobacteraceae bacterium]
MNKSVFVFLSFLTTVSVNLFAQTASLLSTETIGLGKFDFANNVSTQGMGGLSTIYQSPFGTELNFNNPAANSNLSQTVFDINGFYGYSSQVITEKDNSVGGFNFNRISLGFPISDKIKFGLSYKQFTNANEEKLFSKSTISNGLSFDATDSYGKTEVNSINGGLKKLESFVSYNYSKSLSLGLNVGYFSGNIANVSSEIISNQVENPSEIKTIGIEDPKNYNIRKNIEAQSTDDIGVKSLAF